MIEHVHAGTVIIHHSPRFWFSWFNGRLESPPKIVVSNDIQYVLGKIENVLHSLLNNYVIIFVVYNYN